jgi:hypothetical protein
MRDISTIGLSITRVRLRFENDIAGLLGYEGKSNQTHAPHFQIVQQGLGPKADTHFHEDATVKQVERPRPVQGGSLVLDPIV